MRGFVALGLLGFIPAFSYLKYELIDKHTEEQRRIEKERQEAENDRKARETLFYNNLGAPTKPTRSMEEFMTFIASSEAIEKNSEYLSYGLTINSDQLNGLDSYSTEND